MSMLLTDSNEGDSESNLAIIEIEKDNSEITSITTDSVYGDLVAADEISLITADEINENVEADVALEAISNYLNESLSNNTLNNTTLAMANVAIESICSNVNYKSEQLVFSMEAYNADPSGSIKLALEDIKERAAALWTAVKNNITTLAKYIGEKMNFFRRNLSNMKADILQLEKGLGNINKKTVAKSKYLKPQGWFIDLMYSDKGMPDGLKGIGDDVDELLKDHRKMATTCMGKYSKWLTSNYREAQRDPKVFNTLKVSKDEFLLKGAKEFNRSIGFKAPHNENMFYRSKELPGNKAFYTSVKPLDRTGISAIGLLADVSFRIDDYDPQSYKLKMVQLTKIAALATPAWAAALALTLPVAGAVAGVALYGASLGAIISNAKVENTGNTVSIEDDMVFKTLSLDECKRVLNELSRGAKLLQEWYTDVLEKDWTNSGIGDAYSDILGFSRIEVYNNSGFRALKRYCMALIHLMSATTVGTHVYAFRTYDAMMNYVYKSLRQYK